MTQVEIHLGGNSENANYNNYSGISFPSKHVNVGDAFFWSYWECGLRFQLPFWKYTTINSAYLYMYLLATWNNYTSNFTSVVKIEDVDDASELRRGIINRSYYTTTVDWLMDYTVMNEWYNQDITPLISYILTRSEWEKNNHICIYLTKGDANNEIFYWNCYHNNYIYAPYLLVDYTLDSKTESDIFTNSDSNETSFTNPSTDKFYLDDIEIYPEVYEADENYAYGFKKKINQRMLPSDIVLSVSVDYPTSKQLQSLVGKNVPLWYEGKSYNTLIRSCDLIVRRNNVEMDINLINTTGD